MEPSESSDFRKKSLQKKRSCSSDWLPEINVIKVCSSISLGRNIRTAMNLTQTIGCGSVDRTLLIITCGDGLMAPWLKPGTSPGTRLEKMMQSLRRVTRRVTSMKDKIFYLLANTGILMIHSKQTLDDPAANAQCRKLYLRSNDILCYSFVRRIWLK